MECLILRIVNLQIVDSPKESLMNVGPVETASEDAQGVYTIFQIFNLI